jgi:hypothetical protein
LTGTGLNYNSYYFLPFMRVKQPERRKEKRKSSLSGLHENKKVGSLRSIDHARVTSAKSNSKRVITSSKNLHP